MSSCELSEWIAYDQLDRIPDPYWSSASICWAIASFMGSGKKKYKIDDFIPRETEKKTTTPEEGLTRMRLWAEQFKVAEAVRLRP